MKTYFITVSRRVRVSIFFKPLCLVSAFVSVSVLFRTKYRAAKQTELLELDLCFAGLRSARFISKLYLNNLLLRLISKYAL